MQTHQSVWKEMTGLVKGYSSVCWYAQAEIEMEIARKLTLLPKALDIFEDRGFGDAHTKAMQRQYRAA